MFAAATLIECSRPGFAPLGTSLVVGGDGTVSGDIGAGCYEAEIVESCLRTIGDGVVREVVVTGSDDAIEGGTGCRAKLRVAVWVPRSSFGPAGRFLRSARATIRAGRCAGVRVRSRRLAAVHLVPAQRPRPRHPVVRDAGAVRCSTWSARRRLLQRDVRCGGDLSPERRRDARRVISGVDARSRRGLTAAAVPIRRHRNRVEPGDVRRDAVPRERRRAAKLVR